MAQKTRRLRRTGRGAVLLITVMLLSSALLRLGSGAGQALAEALQQPDAEKPAMQNKDTDMAKTDVVGKTVDRNEMSHLLRALQDREKRVRELEIQIDVRSKALSVADEEITKRLATLEQAETNLRRTLSLADGAAEDDLARLTAVYENMKPKDAAALFEAMEPDFAAGFLGRMRPDAAAAVMTGLTPERAYSISAILAGRNATAPKS